jgi:hypothetical protein
MSYVATNLTESDKVFWHRYIDFYEPFLAGLGDARNILEFGVFHGDSIRYLMGRFPNAALFGADILPLQPDWTFDPRVQYFQIDQNQPSHIQSMFDSLSAPLDMVIEDGSHLPVHQRHCLVASLSRIRNGGIYILEDLHTSHPEHSYAQDPSIAGQVNCYQLLLAFEHLKSLGQELSDADVAKLSTASLFEAAEVRMLFRQIDTISFYHRSTLPLRCYDCGSSDFDYARYRCSCGIPLMGSSDSISAVLTIKH